MLSRWHLYGLWLLVSVALPALGGCVQRMALDKDAKSLDVSKKSVAVLTLTVKNDSKPDYGVAPVLIHVTAKPGGTTMFRLAGDWEGKGEGPHWWWTGSSEFPVSVALEPGKYTIGEVYGTGTNVLFSWRFRFPLDAEFDLPAGAVVYLGHVVMTNRQRKPGERASGWAYTLPLIDQAVSGMAEGAVDITISDASAVDIPKLLEKYPCLKGITFKKAILSRK